MTTLQVLLAASLLGNVGLSAWIRRLTRRSRYEGLGGLRVPDTIDFDMSSDEDGRMI